MAVLLRPGGYATVYGPDGLKERDTITCCHCGAVSFIVPGSGKTRGFCRMCMKPTCGKKLCLTTCVPLERKLEVMENRRRFQTQVARQFRGV